MENENVVLVEEIIKPYKTKEYQKEKNKKHYIKHKEKLLNNMKEKIKCEVCNCYISRVYSKNHTKTKRHIKNIIDLKDI